MTTYNTKRIAEMRKQIASLGDYAKPAPVQKKAQLSPYRTPSKVQSTETPPVIKTYRGLKGDKGDKGDTGKTGITPIPGIDFHVPKEETPSSLAAKLNTLSGVIETSVLKGYLSIDEILKYVIKELKTGKNRLEAKDITNLPQTKHINTNDLRWHGSGVPSLTAGSNITLTLGADGGYTIAATPGSVAIIPVTGTIDDSNMTFTSATQPAVLSINGALYGPTGAAITWTWVATVITLSSPVGQNGNIFGI